VIGIHNFKHLVPQLYINISHIIDEQGHDKEVKLPLLGLFDDEHIDYEVDRNKDETPNLAELTRRGLEIMESGKYCCNRAIRDVLDSNNRISLSSNMPRVTFTNVNTEQLRTVLLWWLAVTVFNLPACKVIPVPSTAN
jgi:hypothetical protein